MKKKIVSVFLAASMTAALAAGCGSTGTNDNAGSNGDGTVSGPTEAVTFDETQKCIVTYLYGTTEPEDLSEVQDAVNEITIPAINVEVEFYPMGIGDSFTNYSLLISSGEQIDLMMLAFQDIKTYSNSGQIEELDAYVSEAAYPTLYALSQEYPIATTVSGTTYGYQPVGVNYGNQAGLIANADLVAETGLQKDEENAIYSMDEIEAILAAIKANHPDCYPFGILGSSVTSGSSQFNLVYECEFLGSNVIAGGLFGNDSTTVENVFASEQYKEFLSYMAKWFDAGYILPDAATTEDASNTLMTNEKIAMYIMSQKPEQFNSGFTFDLTGLATAPAYIGVSSASTSWVVPITANDPAVSLKLLDYLYENHELSNLILYGIEGEHYVMEDESVGLIAYPEGVDANNSTYNNQLGLWGDRRYEYTFSATATREDHEAFTSRAMENKYQSYGFTFDSSDVQNQMLACQEVLNTYQKALETGVLGEDGWEATYEQMLAGLETAGINDVIAACQEQLDAYLAQ